jgi:pyruvate dehydrogenase (quinone)
VLAAADKLGAGVAKALLGKAVVPDDLPFVTGPMGLLGSKASDEMMQHCDTLFMIGSSFPYVEFLPKEGKVKAVQIDVAPRNLSLRYPMNVALHGDARNTLRALLPYLEYKRDRAWRARVEAQLAWFAEQPSLPPTPEPGEHSDGSAVHDRGT